MNKNKDWLEINENKRKQSNKQSRKRMRGRKSK